jgi:restriction endonuclease S subunit
MSSPSINMATDHPSVQKLASVVKVVRDRLRKVGITDMDSMMHNVLFVAARMLDDDTIKKLGIPSPLLWTNLMKKVNDKDNDGADKQFKNILDILDAKFGMKRFPYMLESTDDFVSIMKAYNEVDIHEAAKHTDVLGYIYEQHLSTGSGSGRDLGKFYTDRQITRYLTELLGVDVSSLGRPDSMCDATMGTGGFILSYIDLVHAKHPDIKWEFMDLAGGDIDDKVAAIARLNVFLRTGKIFPMIRQRNTLKNDICDPAQPSERRTFNRLLMNIPFGVKGLTLADDCCARVKEIVKAGTKSEPLFMALVCQLLAEGGRAAVIVPDGVLVNCSKQHDAMRKYLLDNFKVLRIIKMRGKFFMNTGIQPSVIVFERSGKTEEVEFWDVEKVASGELVEKCEVKVSREKFDVSCSFDMRRYQEVAVVANPAGFPMVRLGDICNDISTSKNIPSSQRKDGEFRFFTCSRDYSTHNESHYDGTYLIHGSRGSTISESVFATDTEKFAIGTSMFLSEVKDKSKVNTKYLYYYLKFNKGVVDTLVNSSAIPMISKTSYYTIEVLLPPLETQQQIVQALDLIYNNAAAAKATATSIKAQMAAVMRSVGARGFEKKKLGDICEFNTNIQKHDTSFGKETGAYPFYTGAMNIKFFTDAPDIKHLVIIMNRTNGAGKCNLYIDSNCAVAGQTIVFYMKDKNTTTLRYLYYYLNTYKTRIEEGYIGSNHKNMSNGFMEMFLVELPPLPIQEEVLAKLNEMEAELKVMEDMAAKAEQRAKYILDGYLTS